MEIAMPGMVECNSRGSRTGVIREFGMTLGKGLELILVTSLATLAGDRLQVMFWTLMFAVAIAARKLMLMPVYRLLLCEAHQPIWGVFLCRLLFPMLGDNGWRFCHRRHRLQQF